MGESESESKTKLSLRLVVDEEKNKVVLAEACRDFVDILFSLLTLPVGTIVRLLEEHRKSESVTVGCFGNLYKSVVDMGIGNFETEACKHMLIHPTSVKEVKCRRLKLNINPTDDLKYFSCCPLLSCKKLMCSNFSTSQCQCGKLMNKDMGYTPKEVVVNNQNGVFISNGSAFIIMDDLKVEVRSTDLVLKKLKSVGCGDFNKVGEMLVDVGIEEVLTLLECIFSSNAPLTDAFLNKRSPQGVIKTCESSSPYMERKRDESEAEQEQVMITLSAIMRKLDMKVLYVECGEDFVDLLFTFLAVPLESVLDVSGNSSTFGFLGNLFKSFKDLSETDGSTSESKLPHFYKCKKQLLNIITENPQPLVRQRDKEPLVLMDPKSHGSNQSTEGSGFAKKNTKFTVTDDLIITPMSSSSTFCLLKKLQIQADDLAVQEISITKTEATSLLRAALVTSSALTSALKNLTLKIPKDKSLKKPKKETT